MKKSILFSIVMFATLALIGQTQQGFNYQAIARDNTGVPKANSNVGVKFSILQGSSTGNAVYEELHNVQTNQFGLMTLTIGKGWPNPNIGSFNTIDWTSGSKFLKVEIDNQLTGTTQLMSVPFALFAERTKLDAGQGINVNGSTISNTGDLSNTNEIQQLQLNGSTLSLTNGGNSVSLPVAPTYTQGTGISISSGVISNTGDGDSNPTNELQFLSISGNQLVLSNNGGTVNLPSYAGGTGITVLGNTISNNGDLSNTNELQTLSLSGNQLSLSNNGGTVNLPVSGGTTYNAGTGIAITGTTIMNTGDTNASDDITTSSNAGGDLTGQFNNLQINTNAVTTNEIADGTIQGIDMSQMGASSGQVMKWNGSTWTPSSDNGQSYSAGTGISISGNMINNTGDTNASDDITTSSNAGGDLTGQFSSLKIKSGAVTTNEIANGSIQAVDLSSMGASSGDLLKWNGSSWAPNTYATVSPTWIPPNQPGPSTCATGFLPFYCNKCASGYTSFKIENTCNGTAIEGVAASTAGIKAGVLGKATGYDGNGTWGECNSGPDAWGVYGMSTSGYGIVGFTGTSNRAAGLFNNRVVVTNTPNDPGYLKYWSSYSNTTLNYWGVSTSSDKRLKKNIEPVHYGLKEVLQMKPVEYNWKTEADDVVKSFGFIAQEMITVIPNVVIKPEAEDMASSKRESPNEFKNARTEEEPKLSMKYQDLIPVLVKAIQEQQAQIEDLSNRLEAKEIQIENLAVQLKKVKRGDE